MNSVICSLRQHKCFLVNKRTEDGSHYDNLFIKVQTFGNLKYDSKLYLSDQLERSSSQMVAKPSAPQTGQLQASLFGGFGTLRPLPHLQTSSFRIPSHTIEFGSTVGSNKALAYQEKQSIDGCCDGMADIKQNINFGSFSAFKNFAAHEEYGMLKQDTSAMVRYAAEGSQSIKNSEITQLSSIGTSNSTEAQPDDNIEFFEDTTISLLQHVNYR
jgi:hypothetical protein